MNNNNDLEEFITSCGNFSPDINKKIEAQILKRKAEKNRKMVEIRSIKNVSPDTLFSKNSYWIATNLATMIEFELSGVNVDMYVGDNTSLRKLLLAGVSDGFTRNGLYIKFHHALQKKKG